MDLASIEKQIEDLREVLNQMVENAQGNLQAPMVYELSRQLDGLISEYMHGKKAIDKSVVEG